MTAAIGLLFSDRARVLSAADGALGDPLGEQCERFVVEAACAGPHVFVLGAQSAATLLAIRQP
ncbi:hypothetical protein GCM10022380_39590 [Amycolatopsis tucumanensis]|uniref:Uncharacterized protein n=1 Tax=Amycolatopsis tucumanensis TaxID=401106 RepID=A0ABP7IFL6_9PSEU